MAPSKPSTSFPRSARVLLRNAILATAAISPGRGAATMTQSDAPAPIAPARDGNIAIAEELAAARRAGTVAAYDLFLARHPAHPLARTARRERCLIVERNRAGAN
jgi:hypothetical protein